MSAPVLANDGFSTPEDSGVEFGRSADDFPVARIGDLVFAMVHGRDSHFVASAWLLPKLFDKMVRDDFHSHHGSVEDETAFRARMAEQAEHSRELQALDRKTMRIPASTPWGGSQGATVYAEGITCHSTSGHGGFKLSGDRNRHVHPVLRKEAAWYEEDIEWAIVALTFPQFFTTYERSCADKTIRDAWPDAWETITGVVLAPGESHEKDRRSFEAAHAGDWIVISALRSDHHAGMTEVIATRGGKRGHDAEERRFLVSSGEYEVGHFGFVIDQVRHAAYDGPSSFVSWRGRAAS